MLSVYINVKNCVKLVVLHQNYYSNCRIFSPFSLRIFSFAFVVKTQICDDNKFDKEPVAKYVTCISFQLGSQKNYQYEEEIYNCSYFRIQKLYLNFTVEYSHIHEIRRPRIKCKFS